MAAATVIHFGTDECHRVAVLRRTGYEVRASDSLERLRWDLQRDEEVDAVIVSGVEPRRAARAAALVRMHSCAPLILFRRPGVAVDTRRFDRVLPWSSPEPHWLFDTAVLVMQCRELRAQSQRLRQESQDLRAFNRRVLEDSERECTRAAEEIKRNRGRPKFWHQQTDQGD